MHQGHIGMRAYSAQVPSSSLRIIFQSLGLFPTHGAAESPDCLPKPPSPFFACVRVDNIKKTAAAAARGIFHTTRFMGWMFAFLNWTEIMDFCDMLERV
jgi:hypothetical protein